MAKQSLVDILVPDEVYDPTGWDGDLSVPTKNAIRDAIEALNVPAGSDTQVQFNDGGTLGADSNFIYDKVNTLLQLDAAGAGIQMNGTDVFLGLNDCYVYREAGHLRITAETSKLIKLDSPIDVYAGIASPLIPDSDDAYDIGSATKAWAGLYLGPDEVIHFNDEFALAQVPTSKHTAIDSSTTSGAKVLIRNNQGSFGALLDTTSISGSNKTFTFPNTTGTLALTSQIPTVPGSNTQVIYNNSGSFGANAAFTFDASIANLAVTASSGNGGIDTTSPSGLAYITFNSGGQQSGVYGLNGNLHLYCNSTDAIIFDDLIGSSILPSINGGYDLGSNSLGWNNLYLNGGGIYIDGTFLLDNYSTTGIAIGNGAGNAVVAAAGNNDLILRSANTTTATITIADGTNGGISLTPHGTGKVVVSTHLTVTDDAYNATSWNGNNDVPTKNAIRDKIESMSTGSGITRTVVITSGNATMGSSASTDYVYFVAGAHTLSLPAASGNTNRYTVKNNHSANITIDTAGAENIEGAASISVAPEESVDLMSDGTNWFVI